LLDGVRGCGVHIVGVCDVDLLRYDICGWEGGAETVDGRSGLVWAKVEEGEAGDAVLEEGAGGFEGESAAATGYCGTICC